MGAAEKFDLVSVEDYLAQERMFRVRHEYMGGRLYALEGESIRHRIVRSNMMAALATRLENAERFVCQSGSNMCLRLPSHVRFYYPDISVVCRPRATETSFDRRVTIIAEVMSDSTSRPDQIEKKDAYLRLPSLDAYLIVQQETAAILVYRRSSQGFEREVYSGTDAVIPLPTIEAELPLAEAYEAVEFSPEITREDD